MSFFKGKELRWIDHQNGKLGYYFDENRDAVLCDFVGDDTVLFLPAELGPEGKIVASDTIPDESFQSCKNVEWIILDCYGKDWTIGLFVFTGCQGLRGLIELKAYFRGDEGQLIEPNCEQSAKTDEFSFTRSDFTPREIPSRIMHFHMEDHSSGAVKRFIDIVNENDLGADLFDILKYDDYTDFIGPDLDWFDRKSNIKKFEDAGVDPDRFVFLGLCWKAAKQGGPDADE